MRQITLTSLAVLCAATVMAADNKGEKTKSDHDLIQGKWKIVSWVEKGEPAPKLSDCPFTHLEFTADKLSRWAPEAGSGKPVIEGEGKFKLDASKQPKTMQLTFSDKKGKPMVVLAIYALDGDQLKLSVAPGDKSYPTRLESKAGDNWLSLVLQRIKKENQ